MVLSLLFEQRKQITMKTSDLRQKFLEYFKHQHHHIVPSSSLIPANDPTLLFVNAGMVQFKDVFLGLEHRPYVEAASVQRCVRAGGKHNDLENVGFTARHHTFFEMLGNFSFGAYFKQEAIRFAWRFLTEELNIPAEKLWVTVYEKDQETEAIWFNEIKIDPARFSRCGEASNFWSMGDTGPCGPCTEIFYDHGPEVAGGPPGSPEEDGDRYIEIWNLVFMQYERQKSGELIPLPKPSVDTGMGLERIAAVMQGVHSNYEIDLFQQLIQQAAKLTSHHDLQNTSLKVIADHIRSCSFLIADGVRPSNEGRGYVLRRIIRRAVRHGYKLGMKTPFFHQLVATLAVEMGSAYPILIEQQAVIEQVLLREEQQFAETLEHGMRLLENDIAQLTGDILSGETAFKLYDTYGFPLDLTADIVRERGLQIDSAGFEQCMQQQRERSQASSKFSIDYTKPLNLDIATCFTGYENLSETTTVLALLQEQQTVDQLQAGTAGCVILANTPFYAESGGQVGDQGLIATDTGSFLVTETRKVGEAILHIGRIQTGILQVGQSATAQVDIEKRKATAANHSATHLLHAALRQVLGLHVIQKGSLVDAERLRFDFSHHQPLLEAERSKLEEIVNQQIRANYPVVTELTTPEAAQASGAMALFGEKYGDKVRVLSMGDFSKELCGGTHVQRTGDIGLFKIINEMGVAAGIRRLEAVTAQHALDVVNQTANNLRQVAQILKVKPEEITDKVKQLQEQAKNLDKQIQQLQRKLATGNSTEAEDSVKQIAGVNLLVKKYDEVDVKLLREMLDQQKAKLGSGIIVLVSQTNDNKIHLLTGVTKDLVDRFHAGNLVAFLAEQLGGKGGGRPDMAQAGGHDIAKLPSAIDSIETWIKQRS